MTQRIVGIALIVLGIVTLAWGGVFWTNRDTVLDVGSLEITTQEREGVRLPPVVGVLSLVGGIVLLVVPMRRKA